MERALRLLPLHSGEAQLAAQQLPADRMLEYDDLKRAILQRVGRTPEQHQQWFCALMLREVGRPFAFAHQLRDACRRWLRDEDRSTDEVLDRVVLEQFIARLPPRTEWVQCQ
ncbi:zinc finger protein 24-like [Silurus meridionalis]|uniref:zinc finger protein 24-like n=1 Tax=Silurus meridionalis TaxID=175797 RepID=UPI001EEB0B50|nr:zinc finger protein 24-like [Silurus meridionalis]